MLAKIKSELLFASALRNSDKKVRMRNEGVACLSAGIEGHISFCEILLYHTGSMIV